MKILTVKQPWAWLIIHGGKNIENRSWRTPYRGPLIIQSSSRPQPHMKQFCDHVSRYFEVALPNEFEYGGIIGVVDLVECVRLHDATAMQKNKWFEGPVGWVLENPVALPFMPFVGALHLQEAPPSVEETYRMHQRSR